MKRFVLLLLALPVFAGVPTGARNADAATTYVAIIWEGKSEMTNRTAMG